MKIAVLTSSRADYSIYLPLLKKLQEDKDFDLSIIAFGTHLSKNHGYTINNIITDGFNVKFKVETMPDDDSPKSIAKSMGETIKGFAEIWATNPFDLVFALGDRFEMFAAVASTVPYNIKIAHIHGGETTLGAIDDAFRHSITLMSHIHFAVAEDYKNRIVELKGDNSDVYNVGSLSIDNQKKLKLFDKAEFFERFKIDLDKPSILITFHPETVSFEKNEEHVKETIKALHELTKYQLIITMPNADTMGNMVRDVLRNFIETHGNAVGVESFGTIGYLTAMNYCEFLLGNTSSGFVEASFFPKKVINLGDRQKGRIITPNIYNVSIIAEEILTTVKRVELATLPESISIYGVGNTAEKIVSIIKNLQ
ncbi:MAG: UDP-N-acetylglucosamine 2-epimerase (hydrolyzing) [Bacteroidetes bacterium]|nr:UDP-N-acetylglucosamine 2-epimerase (hydrolyzing) [Bacteroidota bacterium]